MHVLRRFLALLLLGGLTLAARGRAGAQDLLASDKEVLSGYNKALFAFPKLLTGQQQPTPADKDLMDGMAKWMIYRFVATPPNSADQMEIKRRDFRQKIEGALTAEALKGTYHTAFVRQFGPVLVKRYRDLFDRDFQDYRYPIVNAAPTLVDAAKLRDDALGDYLAELITDQEAAKNAKLANKHDVIKLYALRGLREYYAEVVRNETNKVHKAMPIVPAEANAVLGQEAQKKLDRDQRWIGAVLKFAETKAGAAKRPPEEQEAMRFLRREAIQTLAATQAPLIVYGKKVAEGPIAPHLLRVLAGNLEPAPSLSEKLEAAIGICQMKYKNVEAYQPEVGVYLVGQFLADFMTEASKDAGAVSAKKLAWMHWRMGAKRMEAALKDMAANAKVHPTAAKGASRLEQAAAPLLRDMSKGKVVVAVNQGMLNEFRKVARSLRPKSGEVFKDMPMYSIELGE